MKHVVILTNYRSASQHLVNLMHNTIIGCTIPKYSIESTEILNHDVDTFPLATRLRYFKNNFGRLPKDWEEVLDHSIEITKEYMSNYKLFKIFKESMPINHKYSDWLLENFSSNKINAINLERKNTLHRFVSLKVAEKKQMWHTQMEVKSATKVEVSVDELLYFIDKDITCNNAYHDKFKDCVYNLSYEDLVRDPKNSVINMTKWFQELIGPFENTTLKQTNPFTMQEVINNYKEVEKKLVGTEHEWMLY